MIDLYNGDCFFVFIRNYCANFNKPIKFGCDNFQCTLGVKILFSKKAIFITRIKNDRK